MLEAKICEAGPGDKRPNPVSVSEALRSLAQKNLIHILPKKSPQETSFYAPISTNIASPGFQSLYTTRRFLYLQHKGLTERNEFCSDVLEEIVDSAIVSSGCSPRFLSRYPSQNLPKARPLDFVVTIDGTTWGGEIKNVREWLYPDDPLIWLAISKCIELDVVPLLVTRKLPYVTFLFFGKIGMVGFQTHFQFFHPTTAPELARVIAVDGMGYKDIRCSLAPPPQLMNFFSRTLPKIGSDFQARFTAHKDLLKNYADVKGLADKNLNHNIRKSAFSAAWNELFGSSFTDAAS